MQLFHYKTNSLPTIGLVGDQKKSLPSVLKPFSLRFPLKLLRIGANRLLSKVPERTERRENKEQCADWISLFFYYFVSFGVLLNKTL